MKRPVKMAAKVCGPCMKRPVSEGISIYQADHAGQIVFVIKSH